MNDPHLLWIADCRAELSSADLEDIETNRAEAEAALARVQAAGDPRGIGPQYEALLAEFSLREQLLELEDRLAEMSLQDFRDLLQSPSRDVRLRAIQRAEQLDLPGAFEVLDSHLVKEADGHVTATGVKALGPLGGDRAVAAFDAYRTHLDPRVRANAIEGMCSAGARPEQLILWADDLDHRVRANVAFGLMDAQPRKARELFRGLLQEPSQTAQKSVVAILTEIDTERFLELFLDALEHLPAEYAGDVFAAMTRRPDPRVARLLLEMLEDEEKPFSFRSKVMQAARNLAGRCGEEHESYQELLTDAVAQFLSRVTADERKVPETPQPVAGSETVEEPDLPLDPEAPAPRKRLTGAEQMKLDVKRHVRLNGRVMDSSNRKPIPRATVRLASSGRQEITDRRGRFSMDRLLRGDTYVFVVERQGYPTRSIRYRVSGGQDQTLQILLIGTRS